MRESLLAVFENRIMELSAECVYVYVGQVIVSVSLRFEKDKMGKRCQRDLSHWL